MRIGLVAPPWLAVPPVGYGGIERVVDVLARGLEELGHDVVLFTVGTSTCPVPQRWHFAEPVPEMGTTAAELSHVLAAYDALRAAGVDVVHDHTLAGPFVARGALGLPPVVVTHHGVFDPTSRALFVGPGLGRLHLPRAARLGARGAGRRGHPPRHRPRPDAGRSWR